MSFEIKPATRQGGRLCTVKGCKKTSMAMRLCQAHYRRLKLYGNTFSHIALGSRSKLFPKFRPIEETSLNGKKVLKVNLTKGHFAIVDCEDLAKVNHDSWHSLKGKYAVCRRNKTIHYMHREIIGCADGFETDHINGNGLDNRRSNLRQATHSQNGMNKQKSPSGTSKYRGVSLYRPRGKWQSQIKLNGKNRGLGHFKNELDAALAYDSAAQLEHGTFAKLNFGGVL